MWQCVRPAYRVAAEILMKSGRMPSHWSLEHDRSLSRDISTVSGVEDGYTHAHTVHTSLM